MKPIYKPKGRALEYSPDALACNIYTGCPHRCYYCFAPQILRMDREKFHSHVEPRKGIVRAVKQQLVQGDIKGKLIHSCFTCDPYPVGYDATPTREIIKAIKESGNHVQILTKGGCRAERDFDLLDENDWVGATITGYATNNEEPKASSVYERLAMLIEAHKRGINTWVSNEPVIDMKVTFELIEGADFIDLYRIGKLNYHPSDIDWSWFGHRAEELCKQHGKNYYIKDDLRKEMGDSYCPADDRWMNEGEDMECDCANCSVCEKWSRNEAYSCAGNGKTSGG